MTSRTSKIYIIPTILPSKLSTALKLFGISFEDNKSELGENPDGDSCFKTASFSAKLAMILSPLPIFLMLLQACLQFNHTTVFITVFFDYTIYLASYYMILSKRKTIVACIKSLLKFPNQFPVNREYHQTSILLTGALIFSLLHFTYGIVYFERTIDAQPPKANFARGIQALKMINFVLHCLFIFGGISTLTVLFAYVSSLLFDRLNGISRALEKMAKESNYNTNDVRQQRALFCNLQKLVSSVNEVFCKIIFLWLLKISIRSCLSAYEVLTIRGNAIKTLGIGIFVSNIIYDLLHLLTIAHFSGKLKDGKDNLVESLIHLGGEPHPQTGMRKELHVFVTLLAHANVQLTASNIFYVTRGTALTLIGSISSYYVLMYQLTSK